MARGLIASSLAALLMAACAARTPLPYDATTRLPMQHRSEAESELQLVVTIREAARTFDSAPGASPRAYERAARYRPSAYARLVADEILRDYGLMWIAEWRIDVLGVHCVVFAAPSRQARQRAIEGLRRDKRIESAQPMQRYRTAASRAAERKHPDAAKRAEPDRATYNDPYYALQRQVEEIRVPEAQRWSHGRGVRVAVIDTGVDLQHPELAGRVRAARNFVDDDAKTFSRDVHGTAVAGLIAAAANNGVGIVGIAPAVDLLALKACWADGPGGSAVCNTITLAEALAFAIENKAAIVNLSLAGPPDPLLRRLVEAALRRGIIVIAADPGSTEPAVSFPLSIPGVLAVGDGDVNKNGDARSRARILAPGHEVLTLAPMGRYDYLSGASLSSAMVSGIAALLLERRPRLSSSEIAAILERTALPLREDLLRALARSVRVVDACGALAAVTPDARCADPATGKPPSLASTSKKAM